MTDTIAAVVVTFNRLKLLQDCIEAIQKQTRKLDEIIVINNGSFDGTKEWLDSQNELTVIHQNNVGGAGGFNRGISEAYNRSFDWIWVMDDDGVPHESCLMNLVAAAKQKNAWYASPNLIDFDGVSHFDKLFKSSVVDEINFIGGPFNAVLLKRELIKEIGFPNPSFFIWGDEYEYTDRIIEKGLSLLTVKSAIHTHKRITFKTQRCPRPYFYVRNKFWRYRAVKGVFIDKKQLKYDAIDVAFRLFVKGVLYLNLKQAREVVKGVYHGIYKNYN